MSKENKDDNIAFKDFKNAITKDEFLSVLDLAKEEYRNMIKILNAREGFEQKIMEGKERIEEESAQMPPGLAEKLLEGLARRANNEMKDKFSKEIGRINHLVDFINRFQPTTEQYEYLNFD